MLITERQAHALWVLQPTKSNGLGDTTLRENIRRWLKRIAPGALDGERILSISKDRPDLFELFPALIS